MRAARNPCHLPSPHKCRLFDFSDDFTGATLRPEWSWNYPYTDVKTEIKNGKLSLSGTPKPGVKTGAALCLRPTSPDYTLETAIVNRNDSWKGITMYGDANNLITCGCAGDRLILKYILEGKEHQLADLPLPASPLYLRMKVTDGTHSTFYWSKDGQAWNEIVGEALSAKRDPVVDPMGSYLPSGIVSRGRSYGTGRFTLIVY